MAHTQHDKAYDRAQARLVREAEKDFQRPDWGREDRRARQAYDRELRRSTLVDGKGRRR